MSAGLKADAGGLKGIIVVNGTDRLTVNNSGDILEVNDGGNKAVFHRGNILGTVSQVAGVPTGSITETGSNSNGEYIKYADGTQMCIWKSTANAGTFTWTYPSPFSVTPRVQSHFYAASGVVNVFSAFIIANSTTSVSIKKRYNNGSTTGDATGELLDLLAIGRWY